MLGFGSPWPRQFVSLCYLLFLLLTHLKTGNIFPVAIGHCFDNESEATWSWFISKIEKKIQIVEIAWSPEGCIKYYEVCSLHIILSIFSFQCIVSRNFNIQSRWCSKHRIDNVKTKFRSVWSFSWFHLFLGLTQWIRNVHNFMQMWFTAFILMTYIQTLDFCVHKILLPTITPYQILNTMHNHSIWMATRKVEWWPLN